MRKFKILILLMLLILPSSVKALSGNIAISCTPTEVKKGETFKCVVTGSSSPTGITDLKAKVTLSDGFSFVSYNSNKNVYLNLFDEYIPWQGDTDLEGNREDPTGNYIDIHTDDVTDLSFSVGEITVLVAKDFNGESGSVGLSNVEYWLDSENASVDSVSTTIKVVEDETPTQPEVLPELKNLTVTSGGNLNKTFSKDESNYIITLDSSDTTKFAINVVAENSDDTITVRNTDTGESIDLKSDIVYKPKEDSSTMSITITVSSNDKSKDYVIIVTRPKPKEIGQPVLSSLVVGGVNVTLKSGKYDYEVTLSADVLESYLVNALLEDEENFKVHDISVLAPNELSGEQEFEIRIIPKDSNSGYGSNTYVIKVVKSGDSSQEPSTPTPDPGAGGDVPNNPSTGNGSAIVMAIVLVLSFAASIYYYKKNISNFN